VWRNHLSLFSGIGGLDLAAEWAGFRTVGFVERDKYCQRVLAKRWPGVPIWDDVCNISASTVADADLNRASALTGDACEVSGVSHEKRGTEQRADLSRGVGPVGLLSGGFPCQPHSVAGKRRASGDERDLWGECARIAGELRPRWCVWENVPGLLTSERGHFFARVLRDMESLGYVVGWATYGAVDVGALHRRDRVFIVCHLADAERRVSRLASQWQRREDSRGGSEAICNVADAKRERGCGWNSKREDAANVGESSCGAWRSNETGECWRSEPEVGRVANGISRRVDRLRALGNAVVPQQAYPIFKAIAEYESHPAQ